MKVILTAFGGKLRSEPMDWPEGIGPVIKMIMDMDGERYRDISGRLTINEPPRQRLGNFVYTGEGEWLSAGSSAAVYRLTSIE